MPAIVSGVEEGSIAEDLELKQGDIILSIDDYEMKDLIDYEFSVIYLHMYHTLYSEKITKCS